MARSKPGTVRIISGKWRGTRLDVPDLPGLRPSGDRSRETLFNWLQAALPGARCADLFAGSGALGLEAASRGASSVVLVEKAAPAVKTINAAINKLGADNVSCIHGNAVAWLDGLPAGSLDIVFIDPPFGSGLAEQALCVLDEKNVVSDSGWVYVETAKDEQPPHPGAAWDCYREKVLGDVRMQLFKKM